MAHPFHYTLPSLQDEDSSFDEEDDEMGTAAHALMCTPSDLEGDLTDADVTLVKEFEEAWSKFLRKRPQLFSSQKEIKVSSLTKQLENLQKSKDAVESEMQAQIEFFSKARQNLEQMFDKEFADARSEERAARENLQKQLDFVAISNRLTSQTIPWEHFLETLDAVGKDVAAVDHANELSPSPSIGAKTIKPSPRAMALVDTTVGDAQDIQLRAYRIDHALLKAQAHMLQREVERYEKTTPSLEAVGKLLTELNVWSILTKSGTVTSSTNSASA